MLECVERAEEESGEQNWRGREDERLALAAHAGDREARDRLYAAQAALIERCLRPALHKLREARGLAGMPLEIDDVRQEAFVIFCRAVEEWEPARTPFVPYLASKVRWDSVSYVRHFARQAERAAGMEDDEAVRAVQRIAARPPDTGESSWLWERLAQIVSSDWERLVRLRYREEQETAEIAALTGRSRRAINRSIRLALEALRRAAEEDKDVR